MTQNHKCPRYYGRKRKRIEQIKTLTAISVSFLNSICRYREVISAHSYPGFQLTIWKYPSLQTVCQLAGHEARIIQLAMSPDGSTVASASADETIRIWKCFAPDKREANKKKPALKIQPSLVRLNMR